MVNACTQTNELIFAAKHLQLIDMSTHCTQVQNILTRNETGNIGISSVQVPPTRTVALMRGTFGKQDLLQIIAIMDGCQQELSNVHSKSDAWRF